MDLLRVLQERRFFRVGGSTELEVDVRVIAATHRDLQQSVHDGTFRDDLFYRLNVVSIQIPTLHERREDIPLLTRHFIERFAPELKKPVADISDGALKMLMDHNWPGNVRELENAIERAMVTSRSTVLTEEDFQFLVNNHNGKKDWVIPQNVTLDEVEKQVIVETLQRMNGNIKETAAALGIDRSTLYDRIKRYNLPR